MTEIEIDKDVALPDDLVFDQDDIDSVVEAMEKIRSSREAVKDIMANIKAQGLNTKIFKKVCKAQFEKNYSDLKAENDLFEKAYESLGK